MERWKAHESAHTPRRIQTPTEIGGAARMSGDSRISLVESFEISQKRTFFRVRVFCGRLAKIRPEMNDSGSLSDHLFFYRIKKFVFKKKLELTQGSFWTTFWKYHDQHSIGKPIEITTSRLRFALLSQWNVDHGISKMLSGKYVPLVITFF